MPLYEFTCRKCSTRFEALCRIGETGRGVTCPECGARRPEKQLSTFAAHGGEPSAAGGDPCACGKPRPFT